LAAEDCVFPRVLGSALVVAAVTVSGQARGDGTVDSARVLIGVDRVAGVLWDRATLAWPDGTREVSRDQMTWAVLGTDGGSTGGTPRFSLDAQLYQRITVGGAVVYITHDARTRVRDEASNSHATSDDDSERSLIVHPRVGYRLGMARAVAFWPRAGLAYVWQKTHDQATGETVTLDTVEVTVEAMIVLVPAPHVGFVIGPYADISVAGSAEARSAEGAVDLDVQHRSLGLNCGLVAWF
jgi:hypothetical protein